VTAFPTTFPALLQHVAATYGERVFLRRRSARGGDPVTFRELADDARLLGAGLLASGVRRGAHVGLVADNRYEWLAADLACASIGAADVPRGSDTAPAELAFLLEHSGCTFAFADDDAVARSILGARERLPALQQVCVLAEQTALPGVLTLRELRERGREWQRTNDLQRAAAAVEPEDLLTIVYTSGTTAEPKGVMLTQRNVLSNIEHVSVVLGIGPHDLFLSVLPAWHMYERIMDYVAMTYGAGIAYTDRRHIKDDLQQWRPTAFAAVPRIWEMLHDGIVNHCHKLGGFRRKLLVAALGASRKVGARKAGLGTRLVHRLYDLLLLRKIRAVTGGRLRIAVSGGGSLAPHVDELLLGLGLPLLNGYGLTETSPVAAVRVPGRNRPHTIGPPIPATEIEIRDGQGRRVADGQVGLLWIRGPQVMRGYYKNEKKTREVLAADGWFNSGDLACRTPDGQFQITGRAKDTIVLSSGENVEPEHIETAIKTSLYIEQAVVVGQDQKVLGALLVPALEALEQAVPRAEWDQRNGELHSRRVQELLRGELDRLLTRANGFRPCEAIASFRVLSEYLTVENGLLTPTMKVKRHVVHERFARQIAGLF
jgi:long-chain acyl-CoA synthetase